MILTEIEMDWSKRGDFYDRIFTDPDFSTPFAQILTVAFNKDIQILKITY